MMTLGENIIRLRKGKNLSQADLARQLHVTRQAISNWERNITTPNIEMLETMGEFFGVGIGGIISGRHKEEQQA